MIDCKCISIHLGLFLPKRAIKYTCYSMRIEGSWLSLMLISLGVKLKSIYSQSKPVIRKL